MTERTQQNNIKVATSRARCVQHAPSGRSNGFSGVVIKKLAIGSIGHMASSISADGAVGGSDDGRRALRRGRSSVGCVKTGALSILTEQAPFHVRMDSNSTALRGERLKF